MTVTGSSERMRGSAQQASSQGDLIDALVQASFMTMAVLNRVSAENDLSLTQLRVLAILRDRRLRISEVADFLGLEKSTMSGLVERAEKRGLLERAPSEHDRRAVEVFLSAEGFDLAERIEARVAKSLTGATGRLSSSERIRLRTLLEQMLGGAATALASGG